MAFGKKQSSSSCHPAYMVLRWVMCALLLLVAIGALVGVYQTHVLMSADTLRLQFGSTSGSLAIIAFAAASMSLMKQFVKCMGPCEICSK